MTRRLLPVPTERALWIFGALGLCFVASFVVEWILWAGAVLDALVLVLVVGDGWWARTREIDVVRELAGMTHQGHSLPLRWGILTQHSGVVRLHDPLHPALAEGAVQHELTARAHQRVWLSAAVVPRQRGRADLAPLTVRVQGPLGLAWAERTLELSQTVQVFPKTQLEAQASIVLRTILSRRVGSNPVRAKGIADELYALRSYLPGDSMRTIDWKASARRNRPVTRESQLDQHQHTVVLVDCGRPMATLAGAMTKLDHTLAAVLALLRAVVASEDTATLVLFSKEIRAVVTVDRRHRSFRPVFERIYNEAADTEEPDYRAVAAWVSTKVPHRSLVILCTSVVDLVGAELVQEAMHVLAKRHRPVLVDLQDPGLHKVATSIPDDVASAYAKVSAMGLVASNRTLGKRLRAHGVDVLSVPASKLAVSLLQHYLDVKARRRV